MATREDNLKKINAELEMLSDDELESVAGGGWGIWLAADANNANAAGGMTNVAGGLTPISK